VIAHATDVSSTVLQHVHGVHCFNASLHHSCGLTVSTVGDALVVNSQVCYFRE
jgi:hypothetical protein